MFQTTVVEKMKMHCMFHSLFFENCAFCDFFFFYWRYNPLWVLSFTVIFFHSALSLHNFLHPLIPIICIFSSMSSFHLFVGFPLFLLPVGFHSSTLLGVCVCVYIYIYIHRVIHKSLRNFRTRLRNNQDRHGRKEHINR